MRCGVCSPFFQRRKKRNSKETEGNMVKISDVSAENYDGVKGELLLGDDC